MAMLEQFRIHTNAAAGLDRARAWYEEKLGLTPKEEDGGGLWYRFEGDSWVYVYKTGSAGTAKNTIAGWTVKNIEKVMEELRSRGVRFEEYDMAGMKTEKGLATFERCCPNSGWPPYNDPSYCENVPEDRDAMASFSSHNPAATEPRPGHLAQRGATSVLDRGPPPSRAAG